MANNTLRQPIVSLVVFALIWFVLGIAIARGFLDALWSAPSALLNGAGLAWLILGAILVVALHIRLLLRIWRLA